jgi:hypothetical protein
MYSERELLMELEEGSRNYLSISGVSRPLRMVQTPNAAYGHL